MKELLPRRVVAVAGLAIIVATNVVVLAGVMYNRSGEPTAVLTLTERELSLPYRIGLPGENSGVSLQLRWAQPLDEEAPVWLNDEKLSALGFDVETLRGDSAWEAGRRGRSLPREALVVLEYDGAAYRSAVADLQTELAALRAEIEKAQKDGGVPPASGNDKETVFMNVARERYLRERLGALQAGSTRLYVIDVGVDYAALHRRHPGRNIVIVPGQVRVYTDSRKDSQGRHAVYGRVERLNRPTIHVPRPYREQLLRYAGERGGPAEGVPRWRITVNWGRRLEPWVIAVEETVAGG